MKKKLLFITLALALTLSLSFAAGCDGPRIIETPKTNCIHRNWSDWKTSVAPTCTSEGTETRTCPDCGEVETNTLKKLDHLFTDGFYCAYGCGAIDGVNVTEGVYEVSNAKGWSWVTKNADLTTYQKIVLTDNIDMANVDYTPWNIVLPEGATLEIVGQGNTIKNLTIAKSTFSDANYSYSSLIGVVNSAVHHTKDTIGTLKITNLKIDSADVHCTGNAMINIASALIGRQFVASVIISDCEVTNSTIESSAFAAGFIGYGEQIYDDRGVKTVFENCSVKGCSIIGNDATAGIMALSNKPCVTITDATVIGNTISGGKAGHSAAALVGTLNFEGTISATAKEVGNNVITLESNNKCESYDEFLGYTHGTYTAEGKRSIADGVALSEDGIYEISNANGMFWFAEKVNGNSNYFNGKTVKLVADIDLENKAWTPIGKTSTCEFRGTFDGDGHTIKNLSITEDANVDEYAGIALFGWLGNNGSGMAYVKNVTIDGATVSGSSYVGAVVGYVQFGSVENCTVKNATITATHKDGNRCGDKAGAVIGFVAPNNSNSQASNCKAENCTVKAARDAGQVIGMAYTSQKYIKDLSATNVTVSEVENNTCTDDSKGNNIRNEVVGREG